MDVCSERNTAVFGWGCKAIYTPLHVQLREKKRREKMARHMAAENLLQKKDMDG